MATTVNNTMVKIQTVTVGSGGASSIDFTSIPQTYTDLYIVASLRGTTAGTNFDLLVQFNGATTNGSSRWVAGIPTDTPSAKSSSASTMPLDFRDIPGSSATASTFGNASIYIPNYASSNYKSASVDIVMENNATAVYNSLAAGLWSSTSAINQVTLTPYFGTFAQYSSATLYGITATPNTTKASGGIIYQDATYMYHVFPYSSTFTPSSTLSCDVLMVAGGGGANAYGGGGGGAGGLRYFSSQSLSATGYTVTVGAGGAVGSQGGTTTFNGNSTTGGGYGTNGGGGAGGNGGSGGGAGAQNSGNASGGSGNAGSYTPVEGYAGAGNNFQAAGGGGGSAEAAPAVSSTSVTGRGGDGTSSYSSWAIATGTGQIVSGVGYYAGGGAGGMVGTGRTPSRGGYGGGGASSTGTGTAGLANTGGGGGGGTDTAGTGSTGGSGVVIIRYAK